MSITQREYQLKTFGGMEQAQDWLNTQGKQGYRLVQMTVSLGSTNEIALAVERELEPEPRPQQPYPRSTTARGPR